MILKLKSSQSCLDLEPAALPLFFLLNALNLAQVILLDVFEVFSVNVLSSFFIGFPSQLQQFVNSIQLFTVSSTVPFSLTPPKCKAML